MNKFYINIIASFIPKKKNRHNFRKKYIHELSAQDYYKKDLKKIKKQV